MIQICLFSQITSLLWVIDPIYYLPDQFITRPRTIYLSSLHTEDGKGASAFAISKSFLIIFFRHRASWRPEVGRRRAEGRRQKADGRRQTAEGRRQTADGRRQRFFIFYFLIAIFYLLLLLPGTPPCYLSFGICHLSFGICHLSFGICHLAFGICHLAFVNSTARGGLKSFPSQMTKKNAKWQMENKNRKSKIF